MNNLLTDTQAAVTDDELDHLIWGIEREGFHARTLIALKELRERRKDTAELVSMIILAIKNEQERLFEQDYLMGSRDCIDVIREEMLRLNTSSWDSSKEAK